jgi:replicative DNA helicase
MNTNNLIVAEQTLLRYIVEDPAHIGELKEEFFISSTAKTLFIAINTLQENGAQLNARNIAAEANTSEERINSFLQQPLPTEGDFSYWLQKLTVERAKSTIQDTVLNNLLPAASAKEGSEFDIDKTEHLMRIVQDQIEIAQGRKNILYSGADLLDTYEGVIKERANGMKYHDTGCHHLNSILMEGFAPGWITTIFGASGVGKSSYALYLINRQINKQIPSLYMSLEMDVVATMDRLIAQRNRIPIKELVPRHSSDEEENEYAAEDIEQILVDERRRLGQSRNFFFIEEPDLNISDVEYYINNVQRQIKGRYLVVTIDLLTMLKEFGGDDKASRYEDAMNKLHAMAKRTGVHIVGVVQSRRQAEKTKADNWEDLEKLRPQIQEIKNSGAIQERSRTIISTFRKMYYAQQLLPTDPETITNNDILEVQILKQNMGGMQKVNYVFNAPSATIVPEMSPPNVDPYTGRITSTVDKTDVKAVLQEALNHRPDPNASID